MRSGPGIGGFVTWWDRGWFRLGSVAPIGGGVGVGSGAGVQSEPRARSVDHARQPPSNIRESP